MEKWRTADLWPYKRKPETPDEQDRQTAKPEMVITGQDERRELKLRTPIIDVTEEVIVHKKPKDQVESRSQGESKGEA
jgi:hypothetical protein